MAARQYRWGRIDAGLGDVNGLPRVTIAPALYGEVKTLPIKGPLVAYRWDGEDELRNDKLVWVSPGGENDQIA